MGDQRYRTNFVNAPGDLTWSVGQTTAANAVTVQVAPGGAGIKNVLKRLIANLGVTGAQTPLAVSVYNAASGSTNATNLLAEFVLCPGTSLQDRIDEDDLDIQGSAATAMTVVMAAPAAGSVQSVNVQTYQTPKTSAN